MRYVLLLQGDKVSAFAMGRAEFGVAVVFNNDPSGHEKFCCYLAERSHSLFSIVLDSKDEEHHMDSIPALSRRDRKRILQKITTRYFPHNLLSTIAVDQTQTNNGNSCAVTASGMPLSNDCQIWLELLDKSSSLMSDICSLSLLGLAIHQVSGNRISLCAIQISQNDFRLMAYHNARLIINRHLKVTDNLADELTDQLQQTQTYMDRLPLVSRVENQSTYTQSANTQSANVQGVDFQDILQSNELPINARVQIIGALSADSRTQLERSGATVISCRAMSRLLGIKPETSMPFADILFAALALSRKSKHASLSMGGYKHHYLARRLRHVFYAASLACFGITAVATAAAVHYDGTYTSLIATTQELIVESRVPDQLNLAGILEADVSIDAIRDSMRLAAQINARTQITPLHFLSSLAVDLTMYPELEITSIHWSRIQHAYSGIAFELKQAETDNESGGYYNATVTGYLQMQPTNKVEALGRFNNFVSTIKSSEQYTSVIVVEAPFSMPDAMNLPVDSTASLQEPFVIELSTRQLIQ